MISQEDKSEDAGEATPAEIAYEEAKAFVLHEHVVTTMKGDKLNVPKASFGKTTKIGFLMKDVIQTVVESDALDADSTIPQLAAVVLSTLLQHAPEKIGEAAAILLDKDIEYVKNELELEEVLALVVPFLASKRATVSAVLGPYLKNLGAMIRPLQATS